MRPRTWRHRIEDMLEAIEKVQRYTAGTTREQFMSDERTIDAVIRNLEVLGEAAVGVPNEVQARYPRIPWRDMKDMRNKVMHEYFGVDVDIIWDTVQTDIPPLADLLAEIGDVESENTE